MPSPTKGLTQPQRVELSNRRLLEAAAALTTEQGWEATTAAEIGRRAGYSRTMVHARYGNKDALLHTLFQTEYERRLRPNPQRGATGLDRALGHFDRIRELFETDSELLRAMFVLSFEAVKTTSAARPHMERHIAHGRGVVKAGLRRGIRDGSVRPDVDVDRAVTIISAGIFGLAYQWSVLSNYDLGIELEYLRGRIVEDYGTSP